MNFAKFLRASFPTERLRWQLLQCYRNVLSSNGKFAANGKMFEEVVKTREQFVKFVLKLAINKCAFHCFDC